MKRHAVFHIDFSWILRCFWPRFGRSWGGFGRLWRENKGEIKVPKAISKTSLIVDGFLEGLGRGWGGFWDGFARFLGGSGSFLGALQGSQGCFSLHLAIFYVFGRFSMFLANF